MNVIQSLLSPMAINQTLYSLEHNSEATGGLIPFVSFKMLSVENSGDGIKGRKHALLESIIS